MGSAVVILRVGRRKKGSTSILEIRSASACLEDNSGSAHLQLRVRGLAFRSRVGKSWDRHGKSTRVGIYFYIGSVSYKLRVDAQFPSGRRYSQVDAFKGIGITLRFGSATCFLRVGYLWAPGRHIKEKGIDVFSTSSPSLIYFESQVGVLRVIT